MPCNDFLNHGIIYCKSGRLLRIKLTYLAFTELEIKVNEVFATCVIIKHRHKLIIKRQFCLRWVSFTRIQTLVVIYRQSGSQLWFWKNIFGIFDILL
jgi:hypothetical protein